MPEMNRLIVFTRYPHPGRTKTRLIPHLGPKRAAELQREMTQHTLDWARDYRRCHGVGLEVHYADGNEPLMQQTFGRDIVYRPQSPGDLGERLRNATESAFESGARAIVLIGADCPGITTETLHAAFQNLRTHDLVLGPAGDGGYYLVGMRVCRTALFAGIHWGSEKVLAETVQQARRLNLSTAMLGELDDVDRPEDLWIWDRRTAAPKAQSERLSIVIPALNEGRNVVRCLASVVQSRNAEVLVVDGGSTDNTRELAAACGATVLKSPPGRARQMNLGAARATGELLLFVHADTRLHAGFDKHIRRLLREDGVSGGAFEFAIDSDEWQYRLLEVLVNRRSRCLQMPYGDQGLFMRRSTFHEIGGFPEVPIMEDFALVRRLARQGRIALAPQAAVTSARAWQTRGFITGTCMNQVSVAAYLAGVPAAKIAAWRR